MRRTTGGSMARPAPVWILCAIALSAVASAALAQHWENAYGEPVRMETVQGLVEVRRCGGGGALAVGRSQVPPNPPLFDTDHYLLRVDAQGDVLWSVRMGTPGVIDGARAVVELADGTGFAVIGSRGPTAVAGPQEEVLLSRIDCNGVLLWQKVLGPAVNSNDAYHLIQATSGTPANGTRTGDLIVAVTHDNGLYRSARLIRTDIGGSPVWIREYRSDPALGALSVAELPPIPPSSTGDLIAVGYRDQQAAVLRVNGDHGYGVCTRQLPGVGYANFRSVTALRSGNFGSGYVAVGETRTSPAALPRLYAVRFGTGCQVSAQTVFGATTDSHLSGAVAETLGPTLAGAPAGLALIAATVWSGGAGNPDRDAVAHALDPTTLAPYLVAGRRYGSQGAGREHAFAIAVGSGGLYLGGNTNSAWTAAGPQPQAYLVRGDWVDLDTRCSIDWTPPFVPLSGGDSAFGTIQISQSGVFKPPLMPVQELGDSRVPCCGP